MLRPRFRPCWQPSWTGTNKPFLDLENGNSVKVSVYALSRLLLIISVACRNGCDSNLRRKASNVENVTQRRGPLRTRNQQAFLDRVPPIPEIIAYAYSMSLSSRMITQLLCSPCYVHFTTRPFKRTESLSHSFPIYVR
jgi:hypothetical protein